MNTDSSIKTPDRRKAQLCFKFSSTILFAFENHSFRFGKNKNDDYLSACGNELIIHITHSNPNDLSISLTTERIRFVRDFAVLHAAAGREIKIQAIEAFSLYDEEKTRISLNIPDSLKRDYHCSRKFFEPEIGNEILFDTSERRENLSSFVTYAQLFAESETAPSRFRSLWAAFNSLYRLIGKENNSQLTCESSWLNATNLLLAQEYVPRRTLRVFQENKDAIQASVDWDKCKEKIEIFRIDSNANSRQRELEKLVERINTLDQEIYCRYSPSSKDREIDNLLKETAGNLPESDERRMCAFILCRYLYLLRCDITHGDCPYPPYPQQSEEPIISLIKAANDDLFEYVLSKYQPAIAEGGIAV